MFITRISVPVGVGNDKKACKFYQKSWNIVAKVTIVTGNHRIVINFKVEALNLICQTRWQKGSILKGHHMEPLVYISLTC